MPKVKQEWKTTHTNVDRFGNTLIMQQEPLHGNIKFILQLVGEKKERGLGQVDVGNKTFYVKRIREKHYMRKVGGYGFNRTIINDFRGKMFNYVLLHEVVNGENKFYRIPADLIMTAGKTLNFKQQGFELQIFLQHQYYTQFPVDASSIDERIIE